MAPNWPMPDIEVLWECATGHEHGGSDGTAESEALALLLWIGLIRLGVWTHAHGSSTDERRTRVLLQVDRECRRDAERAAPELIGALRAIGELHTAGGGMGRHEVVSVCADVCSWAEQRGFLTTAICYAEAAATADSDNPSLANEAGRLCRLGGRAARAEVWYERAIGLARLQGDQREYIRGYLGWGNVLRDNGEHQRALPKIKRAGMNAKRAGFKSQAAEALHDAFTIELLRENFPRAAIYARRAQAVYPRHHRRYPYFAADLAALLVRRGLYDDAHLLLSLVRTHVTAPAERLQIDGLIAWASGGAQKPERYTSVLNQIETVLPTYTTIAPGVLYAAGEGARLLQRWDLAERLGTAARDAATRERDPLTVFFASRLTGAVAGRDSGVRALPSSDTTGVLLRRLAQDAVVRLERWRGPTWRGRD